jgi:hypothetical protein
MFPPCSFVTFSSVMDSTQLYIEKVRLLTTASVSFDSDLLTYVFNVSVIDSSRIDKMKNTLGIDRTSSDGSDQSLLGRM